MPYEESSVIRLANEAIKRNVPLYVFRKGKGFIQVNPRDYINKPTVKSNRRKKILC